jgi:hypothetical protein
VRNVLIRHKGGEGSEERVFSVRSVLRYSHTYETAAFIELAAARSLTCLPA